MLDPLSEAFSQEAEGVPREIAVDAPLVVTETLVFVPREPFSLVSRITSDGLTVRAGTTGAPGCDTVIVWPPMVMVPVLAPDDGFASAETITEAGPLPDAPVKSCSHGTSEAAFQAHPVPVESCVETVPPAAGALAFEGLKL